MNVVFPVPGGPCKRNILSADNAFSRLFNFELSISFDLQSSSVSKRLFFEVAIAGLKIISLISGLAFSLY